MEAIERFVSFYGGLASMVALLITLASAAYFYIKSLRAKHRAQMERLAQLKAEINKRIEAATTQGRRQDLFIYYQSVFSNRRFALTIYEIQVCAVHVVSVVVFLVWPLNILVVINLTSDWPNWNWGKGPFLTVVVLLTYVGFGYVNGLARQLANREQREYESLAKTFCEGLNPPDSQ